MGAEAIKELLKPVSRSRRSAASCATDQMRRDQFAAETSSSAAKRLKVVDAFRKSGNRPEWMILDVIPVIPPELRPLVPLDGGRFATSDLNDLYRRVINRNNRLKKLLDLKAPDVIVRNEKRMLAGGRGRVVRQRPPRPGLRGSNNRPLKSLSDTIKGKQGRFRQNLLGKRVDYSGRSVIVVGPDVETAPVRIAQEDGARVVQAFHLQQARAPRAWSRRSRRPRRWSSGSDPKSGIFLEEVIKEHPVHCSIARPTLHRLGIQAFEPSLVEGKAIKIHPLVCTAFNADFDGDQMAVHVPLSAKAQVEAMRVDVVDATTSSARPTVLPIVNPSQDIVLGCYYLTQEGKGERMARAACSPRRRK